MASVEMLYSEEAIARRVAAIARDIAASKPDLLLVVVVLKGGFVFAADLVRELARLDVQTGKLRHRWRDRSGGGSGPCRAL